MSVLYDGQKYLKSDVGDFSELFMHETDSSKFKRKDKLTFGLRFTDSEITHNKYAGSREKVCYGEVDGSKLKKDFEQALDVVNEDVFKNRLKDWTLRRLFNFFCPCCSKDGSKGNKKNF
jgi:hypothetical protein